MGRKNEILQKLQSAPRRWGTEASYVSCSADEACATKQIFLCLIIRWTTIVDGSDWCIAPPPGNQIRYQLSEGIHQVWDVPLDISLSVNPFFYSNNALQPSWPIACLRIFFFEHCLKHDISGDHNFQDTRVSKLITLVTIPFVTFNGINCGAPCMLLSWVDRRII